MRDACFSALAVAAVLMAAGAAGPAGAQPLDLILPTDNDALLEGDGPAFYMYTNRYFQGRRWQPWQGGQYGYVRNPLETGGGDLLYTRFHEGLDIRPVRRDAAGVPLDEVRAIDDGQVVYVNPHPRRSSYGIYVVVEHTWSGAPFYSLYAHLSRADVRTGQAVVQGERLGRIGYTGRGIDRERAHLHFEIGVLLNSSFDAWHDEHYRSTNRHGVFNGFNLRGIDAAALYQALQEDPDLTMRGFLAQRVPYYRVVVPRERPLDLLARYPWLARHPRHDSPSWEIAFTQSRVPVAVEPSNRFVEAPTVSVCPMEEPYGPLTDDVLAGRDGACRLTSKGRRYLELITLAGPDAEYAFPDADARQVVW